MPIPPCRLSSLAWRCCGEGGGAMLHGWMYFLLAVDIQAPGAFQEEEEQRGAARLATRCRVGVLPGSAGESAQSWAPLEG